MEAKRIAVTGGLDYDNEPILIGEGDGRERSDVSISDNGVISPVLDLSTHEFTDIQFITGDGEATYILDKNSGVFTLYKYTGKYFPVYGYFPPVFSTSESLVTDKDKVSVSCSDGKLLIVNPGEDPIYIDLSQTVNISSLEQRLFGIANGYVVIKEATEPSISAGGYVTIFNTPSNVNLKIYSLGFAGKALVRDVYFDDPFWYVVLDIPSKYLRVNSVQSPQSFLYESIEKIPIQKPYINLNRPIPHLAPLVFMENDPSYSGNNFIDTVFSYGYSFVYADGYETPVSPMSEVNVAAQRAGLVNSNLNKAVISVQPYNGVSKVRFFCKRNNASNDLELIAEKDATALTLCEFYGDSLIGVVDNTVYLKSSEAVPLNTTLGKFLDERVVLCGETQSYDNGDIVSYGTLYESWYKVTGSNVKKGAEGVTAFVEPNIVRFTFSLPADLGYDPTTKSGYLGLAFSDVAICKFQGSRIVDYKISGSGLVYYSNESKRSVGDRLAAELMSTIKFDVEIYDAPIYANTYWYSSHNIYSDSNGNIIVDIVVVHNSSGIYLVENFPGFNYYTNREGGVAFETSMKLGETYSLGVQFFDESGRSGGVVPCPNGADYLNIGYSEDSVQVVKPRVYLKNYPSWARYYQFAVAKRVNTNSQYFIPGKNTAGSWGTTSNAYLKSGKYGMLALNLMTVDHESEVSGLGYSFKEGDYIKLLRLYHSNGKFGNIEPWDERAKWCKVVDVKVTSGVEYVVVDGLPDIEDEYNTETYLQFEVKNFNGSKTSGYWQLIGDRYHVWELTYYTYSPERDGYRHNIEYGDYFVRPVQGLLYEQSVDVNLYVESRYLNDRSFNKECFSPNRVSIIQPALNGTVPYLIGSRPYIDGTNTNGYLSFDYDNSSYLTNAYGSITGIEKVGNRLAVFLPKAIHVMNIGTVEVQSDQSSDSIYVSSYFGNGKYFTSYGKSVNRLSCSDGSRIYYYDTERKAINVISDNGIYDICGVEQHVNGLSNKFMKGVFGTTPRALYYDQTEKKLYASLNAYSYVYDTRFDRWVQKRSFSFDYGVHVSVKTFSMENVFIYPGQLFNAIANGAGETYQGYYDIFVPFGEDVDFLSMVSYSDFKPEIDVNVYGQNGLMFKSKIKPTNWVKVSDGYYCDMPKGCLGGETLRIYHLFEGYDLVGKSIQLKVYITGKFYGIEVRYEKRNY